MKILKNLSWQVATAVLLLLPAVIFAQKQTTEQQVAAIKADVANYYWGEGFGSGATGGAGRPESLHGL